MKKIIFFMLMIGVYSEVTHPLNFSKLWKLKSTKLITAWLSIGCMNWGFQQQEYKKILASTFDLSEQDSELHEVCMQIKNDLKITDPVVFRLTSNCYFLGKTLTNLNFPTPIILLSDKYKDWSKPQLIHTVAHELEHVRQAYPEKYKESYQNREAHNMFDDNAIRTKRECGADAAAADYQYCYECLRQIASDVKDVPVKQHDPRITPVGYFTTLYGYFSSQDYKLWEDRAYEDNALCYAHKHNIHNDPITPLKDFLPTK